MDKTKRWKFEGVWSLGRLKVTPDIMSRPRKTVALVTATFTEDDEPIWNRYSLRIKSH